MNSMPRCFLLAGCALWARALGRSRALRQNSGPQTPLPSLTSGQGAGIRQPRLQTLDATRPWLLSASLLQNTMTDPKLNDSKLDDLATRLSAAREKAQGKKAKPAAVHSAGMGAGMRIAIEMVVAVIIGFGIGYGIDWALGTKPWFMLLFFFLGVAAAFMNAVRTAKELDAANKAARAARNKGQDRAGAADTENATHRGWADEDEEEPWVYQTKKEE